MKSSKRTGVQKLAAAGFVVSLEPPRCTVYCSSPFTALHPSFLKMCARPTKTSGHGAEGERGKGGGCHLIFFFSFFSISKNEQVLPLLSNTHKTNTNSLMLIISYSHTKGSSSENSQTPKNTNITMQIWGESRKNPRSIRKCLKSLY